MKTRKLHPLISSRLFLRCQSERRCHSTTHSSIADNVQVYKHHCTSSLSEVLHLSTLADKTSEAYLRQIILSQLYFCASIFMDGSMTPPLSLSTKCNVDSF